MVKAILVLPERILADDRDIILCYDFGSFCVHCSLLRLLRICFLSGALVNLKIKGRMTFLPFLNTGLCGNRW